MGWVSCEWFSSTAVFWLPCYKYPSDRMIFDKWISDLGTNCEDFVTADAKGYYCTCNTSFCNDVPGSNSLFSRAQAGITGTGFNQIMTKKHFHHYGYWSSS